MMKRLLPMAAVLAILCSCGGVPCVHWQEGTPQGDASTAVHSITINSLPSDKDWSVWFCHVYGMKAFVESEDFIVTKVARGLFCLTPTDNCPESIVVEYTGKADPKPHMAPEGFILQRGSGKMLRLKASYSFLEGKEAPKISYSSVKCLVSDMIPALKEVSYLDGDCVTGSEAEVQFVDGKVPGWYRITVNGGTSIQASDDDGAYYARQTLDIISSRSENGRIPNMVIEDWPDLSHRGLMLDVARNFIAKEDVFRLIDLLSRYKANVLHLHLSDDEGWRLQIDRIPELTDFGSFRCIPEWDGKEFVERNGLIPTYCTTIDRKDTGSSALGYYTEEDFISILKYAAERHIKVIPEFDIPGHSGACIKSVDRYCLRTGDESIILTEPADTSKYSSIQGYKGNVLNPALESTYNFIALLFDELVRMYRKADAPLDIVHIGGDEVARGVWVGSPACHALMDSLKTDDIAMVRDYFLSRVMDIARERNLKVAGWQEIVQNISEESRKRLDESLAYVNTWSTGVRNRKDETTYKLANGGVNVVLSNNANTYMDMAYNDGKREMGQSWAGFIDERRTFSLLPYNLYSSIRWNDKGEMNDLLSLNEGKEPLAARERIIGIQVQLWTETIRSFDQASYYIFPKALGAFERAWNASPSWEYSTSSDDAAFISDLDRFYSVIMQYEIPFYEKMGISYHTPDIIDTRSSE